ncbi:MAG: heme-binding domain-containing protein [Leptospira sp.]|jgi:hypothetical protein|nr:heme-binding domain-containing protein [Leptospira sp.]
MKLPILSKNDRLNLMKKFVIFLFIIIIWGLASYLTRWSASSVPPQVSNSELVFPENINKIFQKSCIDCHTPYTKIPLYGHIFPVTLYLQDHVKEGQDELNLAKWNEYKLKRQLKKAEEIFEEVNEGEMPPTSYLILHPDSKLNVEEIEELKLWSENFISTHE